MNNIRNRIGRLEQSDHGKPGIAERFTEAQRKQEALEELRQSDPQEYKRRRHEEVARWRVHIEETEAALSDGRYVSEFEVRIAHAYKRLLPDEEAKLAAL
jgi:hypothetical protein